MNECIFQSLKNLSKLEAKLFKALAQGVLQLNFVVHFKPQTDNANDCNIIYNL